MEEKPELMRLVLLMVVFLGPGSAYAQVPGPGPFPSVMAVSIQSQYCVLSFLFCLSRWSVCVVGVGVGAQPSKTGLPGLSHAARHVRFSGWLRPKQKGQPCLSWDKWEESISHG